MSNRRYFVICKSGRKFCVEEYGVSYTDWGNVNPATGKIEKVKAKEDEIINEKNTEITKERGYKNICMLEKGTSPMAFIDLLDSSGIERIEADFVVYETETDADER